MYTYIMSHKGMASIK